MVPPGRTQLLVAIAALLLVVAAIGHELRVGRAATSTTGTGTSFGSSRPGGATGSFGGASGSVPGATDRPGAAGAGTGSGWSGAAAGPVVVDVGGAVRTPGVFTMPASARVRDAIERAGGVTARADLTAVNRAAHLVDGQQVVVPARASPATGGVGAVGAGGTSAGSPGAAAPQAPVSLNAATVEQLDALDGVGPATAARIVADREANGPFRSVDDLDRVPGIGPAKLAALRPHLTT